MDVFKVLPGTNLIDKKFNFGINKACNVFPFLSAKSRV